MPLSKLEEAVYKSWSRETSSDPKNWSENNPAWGQSEATAILLNDYFGGEIVWSRALLRDGRKIEYYRNRTNGTEDTLVEIQFPESTVIPRGIQKREDFSTTREYLLSNEDNLINYNILKNRVEKLLKE